MKVICSALAFLLVLAVGSNTAFAERLPPDPLTLEISIIPEQPAVLTPSQILVSVIPRTSGTPPPDGSLSIEIRPVSQKIRQIGSEWYRNVEPYEPGHYRVIHNYRIEGDYELVPRIESAGNTIIGTSRRVTVQMQGAVGFWSETWIKSVLFIILVIGLLFIAGRFAAQSDTKNLRKPS